MIEKPDLGSKTQNRLVFPKIALVTHGEGDSLERREKPLASRAPTVPQTDTGRRVEDTQARERTLVKELGNLTP